MCRLKVYLEKRDIWIGVYVAELFVYVCPLPCVVFRFERRFGRGKIVSE